MPDQAATPRRPTRGYNPESSERGVTLYADQIYMGAMV